MASVSESRGVRIETLPALHREIGIVRDAQAILRLARLIKRERPTILHTHTAKAGAVGRIAAPLAGPARPPIIVHTFHGHVLRGYFNPLMTFGFRTLEHLLARVTTRLIAVSPEVRDDLVRLRVAPASKFEVVRLGIELDERTGNLRAVCNFACDKPALRFRQTGGLRIDPHWAPVPGTTGEHEDGDYCDNQGNESGKDRVVGHRGEGNRGWLFIDIHAPEKARAPKNSSVSTEYS